MQAKLIKDSIANGIRICTFILEYPRIIHSELLTHRVFSRNSASSRAIPTKAVIQDIRDNPADIVWWGKNMSGMQAKEELTGWRLKAAKILHVLGRESAILISRLQLAVGLHKQIANRRLETYQNIRVVVTSTEWNNFFVLRNHKDAQPEFQLLASMMYSAVSSSTPQVLKSGEWHLPYIDNIPTTDGLRYGIWQEGTFLHLSIEEALKISASLAAQESYRKSDSSLEKAEAIWERLVGSAPVHASPTEHQAMAMHFPTKKHPVIEDAEGVLLVFNQEGVTHLDKTGNFWSGNFRGWIQHRQLIPNHHVPG
jgi:hypothetical protein